MPVKAITSDVPLTGESHFSVPANIRRLKLLHSALGHDDPSVMMTWGVEMSDDGGQTWKPWCSAGRPGGQIMPGDTKPYDLFDLAFPVVPGFLYRPFLESSVTGRLPFTGTVSAA